MSFARFARRVFLTLSLLLPFSLRAQMAISPPAQDPLMSLMLSQPKIDLTSPVEAVAAFDPPIVAPGQPAIYRVTLSGLEASTEWPGKIPAPPHLEAEAGAHAEILRLMGPRFQPFTTFNYRVRASEAGDFTIPEFSVNVYGKPVTIPAATLQVRSGPPTPQQPGTTLLFELPSTNLYVGQAVRARAVLPSVALNAMQGLAQVQLTGDDFLVDLGGARQRIEMSPNSGGRSINYVYEASLTPVSVGKLKVFAQGFTTSRGFGGIIVNGNGTASAGPPPYTLLESDPVEVTVKPLPQEGQRPGFTGAIGDFALGTPKLSTNSLQVGETLRLTVTVTNRGFGPLARLSPPPAPHAPDWQIVEGTDVGPPQPVNVGPMGSILEGVTTLTYTLVPLSAKSQSTPAIPFSYFDPERGVYSDLTIPPIPISIEQGSAPADVATLMQPASDSAESEKEPQLSGLVPTPGHSAQSLVPSQQRLWFFLAQLIPALAFVGLIIWDRRRRYFELHPDVLLRRRARRALRREWRAARHAAQAKDATAFAAAAVSAMRLASAPHYPAEPRALVGNDIVALIPSEGAESRLGQVVRRFFSVTDASRFAATTGDARELLGLQPDLDRVLQQLEARL